MDQKTCENACRAWSQQASDTNTIFFFLAAGGCIGRGAAAGSQSGPAASPQRPLQPSRPALPGRRHVLLFAPAGRAGISRHVGKPAELSGKARSGCVSMQELQQSLADWEHNLKKLRAMEVELAQRIHAEDMTVRQQQVEHLHRQWEELCLQVSALPPGPAAEQSRAGWQLALAPFWRLGLLPGQLTRAAVRPLLPSHNS